MFELWKILNIVGRRILCQLVRYHSLCYYQAQKSRKERRNTSRKTKVDYIMGLNSCFFSGSSKVSGCTFYYNMEQQNTLNLLHNLTKIRSSVAPLVLVNIFFVKRETKTCIASHVLLVVLSVPQ